MQDIDELKSVIRNCERLFPEDLGLANAREIKRTFTSLKRENQMKKLAAEVELKLRAIYFNVIRPERVEGIVKVGAVHHVHTSGAWQSQHTSHLTRHTSLVAPHASSVCMGSMYAYPPLPSPPSVYLRGDHNAERHPLPAVLRHQIVPAHGTCHAQHPACPRHVNTPA